MLEETGLPYRVHAVDLTADQQFEPGFLAISPNNKIPAIVDEEPGRDSQPLFESGAILSYLAEKSGMLLPPPGPERWSVYEWLYWSIGGTGPDARAAQFSSRSDRPTRRRSRSTGFRKEGERLLRVLETRLAGRDYIGGADYSIADIASYPWVTEAQTVMMEAVGRSLRIVAGGQRLALTHRRARRRQEGHAHPGGLTQNRLTAPCLKADDGSARSTRWQLGRAACPRGRRRQARSRTAQGRACRARPGRRPRCRP